MRRVRHPRTWLTTRRISHERDHRCRLFAHPRSDFGAGLDPRGRAYAYTVIPKEVPLVYVSTGLQGISPTDAEDLLVKPMEAEFGALKSLTKMTSEAADRVQGDLPTDARDLTITEINTAQFPIITVVLSGPIPERALNGIADAVQDALPGLLEAEIGGKRTEFVEALIDPTVFQTYSLSFDEIVRQVQQNNRLIAASAIEMACGRIVLKVPGLIQDPDDVMRMPNNVRDGTVVTFEDVATIRRAFEDPQSLAHIDGQPALSLAVTKRSGANIIDTIAGVRSEIAALSEDWPGAVDVPYLQD